MATDSALFITARAELLTRALNALETHWKPHASFVPLKSLSQIVVLTGDVNGDTLVVELPVSCNPRRALTSQMRILEVIGETVTDVGIEELTEDRNRWQDVLFDISELLGRALNFHQTPQARALIENLFEETWAHLILTPEELIFNEFSERLNSLPKGADLAPFWKDVEAACKISNIDLKEMRGMLNTVALTLLAGQEITQVGPVN